RRRSLDALPDRRQRAGTDEVLGRDEVRGRGLDPLDVLRSHDALGDSLEAVGPDDVARSQPLSRGRELLPCGRRVLGVRGLLEGLLQALETGDPELERLHRAVVCVVQRSGRTEIRGLLRLRLRLLDEAAEGQDRKSTRLNSSHVAISYAVFCLKKQS